MLPTLVHLSILLAYFKTEAWIFSFSFLPQKPQSKTLLSILVHFVLFFFFFKDFFIYSFMRERDREAETQAEGEAGIIQRA